MSNFKMNLGAASVALLALSMAASSTGCSSDSEEGGTGGTGMGGETGSGGSDGTGGSGEKPENCPEHPAVSQLTDDVCSIAGGEYTDDLHLVAGYDYLLEGKIFIGDDGSDTTLTIDPGVTVFGADKTFIVIQRGAKIMAEGTKDAPIILTSAADERAAGDWGGLVINGKATTNFGDNVEGEAETGKYGGTDDEDNSGSLKYLRVEFGGNLVDDQNELNGIAFQGVGSGTTVDYIQVHSSADDGIEFFGGTVDVKHVFITNIGDDSIDWTGGWRGNAQFIAVQQWDGSGDRGIEADNNGDDNTAAPYSNPTLSNITLFSNQTTESTGALFREGTKGSFHNLAIGNFPAGCLAIDHDQTAANAADGSLVIENSIIECDQSFNEKLGGSETETWFGLSATNSEEALDLTDPTSQSAPDLTPKSGSALLGAGEAPDGDFFDAADYVGAFAEGDDWADGWTEFAAK